MRWLLLAGAISLGCNQFYDLEPTELADLEPPRCVGERFELVEEYPQFADDNDEFDPQLSVDGRELWFTLGTNPYVIHRGIRDTTTDGFTVEPARLIDRASLKDAALTADGRRLMFVDDGDNVVFEAVRTDPKSPAFESVRFVVGVGQPNNGVRSLDLSWDGLRIYYTNADGELWTAERDTRDAPFVNQRLLLAANIQFPTLSGDELELFYNKPGQLQLFLRARADLASEWGPEQVVLDEGSDPDIAPSSELMIVLRDHGLSVLARACPR